MLNVQGGSKMLENNLAVSRWKITVVPIRASNIARSVGVDFAPAPVSYIKTGDLHKWWTFNRIFTYPAPVQRKKMDTTMYGFAR